MNRKVLLLMAISIITVYTFAQAPDMEFFAPTEYMYMTELKDSEREAAIKNTPLLIEKAEHINSYFLDGREYPEQQILYDKIRVFSEILNSETYIWILIPCTRNNDELKAVKDTAWVPKHKYILALLKKENNENAPICIMPTCFFSVNRYKVNAYQIIKGKQKNKGIVHYYNTLDFKWNVDSENRHIGVEYKKTKGQPKGYVRANYYLLDEKPDTIELGEAVHSYGYIPKNWEYIQIDASAFLWDLKKPLKYGLQNAFDGNPATSFVENTEDDLFLISCQTGKPSEKIAIINGYTQNKSLYVLNNRIRETDGYFTLKDNTLNYQFIDNHGSEIEVTKIYPGAKYNDTCISEMNIFIDGNWLFGDLDEQSSEKFRSSVFLAKRKFFYMV